MDLLTQGVLGTVLAQSATKKDEARVATGAGFAAGLLADADVLIRSSSDPLLTIEYHRHFTHSIFFIPPGGLLAALILWPFLKNRIAFPRLLVFCLLGFSLSGFIDACTSYGTYLFWPLLDERVAFHVIAIIDPVFTLALIVGAVAVYRSGKRQYAWYALGFGSLYLLTGYAQMSRAESVAQDLAEQRRHQPQRLIAKPTIGNLLLWRSIYEYDGRIYVDAIRVGTRERVYRGGSVRKFNPDTDMPGLDRDSVLYRDIQRFNRFSDGYIGFSPGSSMLLGDIRYSVVPTDLEPLWGIDVDSSQPDRHAPFGFHRNMDKETRQRFWEMLKGVDVSGAGA